MLIRLLAAALIAGVPVGAVAQDFPSRPITMIVPFAAGGPVDTIGRIMGQRMSELLGQQVVIENQGGAGGMLGAARVSKAAPDGYLLLLGGSAVLAQNQAIYKKPMYDGANDFTFVSMFADSPRILLVRKDLPASNLAEFNAYVKANAVKMQYGSSGVGAGAHVCAVLLDAHNGVKVTHVPYRGAALAMQDLIAGRIDYLCEQSSTAVPQVEGGLLKGLAVMGLQRLSVLPNLATAEEQGVKGLDCGSWAAFVYPKGTPDAIVQRIAKVTDEAVDSPVVGDRFAQVGVTAVPKERRSPQFLARFTKEEIERWGKVIRAAQIAAD